jgi:hypothetical protein
MIGRIVDLSTPGAFGPVKHFQEKSAEPQVPPLRFAPVGMTKRSARFKLAPMGRRPMTLGEICDLGFTPWLVGNRFDSFKSSKTSRQM